MPRTRIYHFTHVDNLPRIMESGGLRCDVEARRTGCLAVDVGSRGIKESRRALTVDCGPGGAVGDYVPFYFAPRSPMLYSIMMGNVPEYQDGQEPLVYLVTDVETVIATGRPIVFCDGNAASALTTFFDDPGELDELIDWDVMAARVWRNTMEDGDRRRRRMAEALVHEYTPIGAFETIACMDEMMAQRVTAVLDATPYDVEVRIERQWYF